MTIYSTDETKTTDETKATDNVSPQPISAPMSIDNTKYVLKNNSMIESNLHCVIMISNPCLYKRRYALAKDYLTKLYPNMIIYLVEIIYKDQVPGISDKNNPRHLQIFTNSPPLWHKENAINIGIKKLLPIDWKAVAWIDADIEFENLCWAQDTLKLLNSSKPTVCQLFSHALDLNMDEDPMTIFQGFGYQHCLGKKHGGIGLNFWHPGFAYACNRIAFDKMGGLYEHSILGSGDHNMALSFIGKGYNSVNIGVTDSYKNHVLEFQKRCDGIILRYTPGVIRHFFHGHKVNRKYVDRWKILVKHKYDPLKHVTYDDNGLLIPTKEMPIELTNEIYSYFEQRNEDEFFND
jgi:hypothetical protein